MSTAEVVPLELLAHGAPFSADVYLIAHDSNLHRLDFAELMYITSGIGSVSVHTKEGARRSYTMEPGRLMLLRPTDWYRYHTTDPAGIATLCVSFPSADWLTFSRLVGIDPTSMTATYPVTIIDSAPMTRESFERAVDRFHHEPTSLDLLQFWLSVAPVLFPEAARSRRWSSPPPDWLAQSIGLMREEANLRAGLSRLVELTHVNPSYLGRATRRYYDVTPSALIRRIRLDHAAKLLTETDEPIGSIAGRCGYDNLSRFSASFRSFHRIQPREYRARFRREADSA